VVAGPGDAVGVRFRLVGCLSAIGRGWLTDGWVQVENPIHLALGEVSRESGCCQHQVPQEPDLVGERLVVEVRVGVWQHAGPPVLWVRGWGFLLPRVSAFDRPGGMARCDGSAADGYQPAAPKPGSAAPIKRSMRS